MSEFHTEVGAYAADALDPQERAAFEAHLASCPNCRRELTGFFETTAELSRLVAVPPPPEIRAAVLGAIREIRPLPPETGGLPEIGSRDASGPSQTWTAPAGPEAMIRSVPGVDELAVRRARRRSRLLTLAVAAVSAVALGLGGWVYSLQQQQQAVIARATAESELLNAADARVYPVTLEGQQTPVTFVVSRTLNRAMLVGADVPDPGAGRTYQLWTLDAAQAATPDETFAGGPNTRTFLSGNVRDAAALAVSNEPEGGSRQPTEILAVAPLT